MSEAPTYEQPQLLVEQLRAQVAELERVVAEQADEIAEVEAPGLRGFVELVASAVVGRAVVEAAGDEALVADRAWSQSGQAAGNVVVFATVGGGS